MINKEVGKILTIIGKVESINTGEHFCNTTLVIENNLNINIKLEKKDVQTLKIGKIYQFEVIGVQRDLEIVLKNLKHQKIEEVKSKAELAHYYSVFYQYAPLSLKEIQVGIESYLSGINNEKIKEVTNLIYQKYKEDFYIHPAATKFHHAYIGGLSYHTLTMLKMIDPMVSIYPYLNKDLLYAGAILHDISKIDEISGVDGEYTVSGQLIGHIVLAVLEIERLSLELGYQDSEEMLLLKHVILSHHGLLNYGSPKRPQIGEALMLWYIDTIDSKFTVLGEELADLKPGEFTQAVPVLDKVRFYKSKKMN